MTKRALMAVTLMIAASAAQAAMTYYLTAQWVEGGNRMCKYGNGTVLNVGINLCPLSIRG